MALLLSFTLRLVLASLVLASTPTTHAASEEWRYGLDPDTVTQVVADGEGGLALLHRVASDTDITLAWLDFKGQQIFKKVFTQNTNPRILAASKRGLTYWIEGTTTIRFVDARGRDSILGANHYPLNAPYSVAFPFRLDDESGIFVYELSTPAFPKGCIVRFKY